MVMSVNVNVDFSDRYKRIMGAHYDKIIDEVLTRTIVEADSICQREAPVDTGTLRRSIGTSHPSMGTVCLTAGVKYWVYNQYGTSKMKANPFVTRTVKKVQSKKLFETNLHEILLMKGIL